MTWSSAVSACIIVPAYDAAATIESVLADLKAEMPEIPLSHLIVVDDGSRDDTRARAKAAGAHVLVHEQNQGKGAALLTGLRAAAELGCKVAVTVDADGQHPARAARTVLEGSADPNALVLGVRDLLRAGAPGPNRFSNGISNYFLSRFAGQKLRDTQCGLRRYPVDETLLRGPRATGYAFEAEIVLLYTAAKLPIVEVDIDVIYPPERERISHFDPVRDPARIIAVVLRTVAESKMGTRFRRLPRLLRL
jgi:glycosyltransferase involved in cell wall biosynthesis